MAALVLPGAISPICIFCDNQGVIAHSNSLRRGLPDKQAQSDLIHLLKSLVSSNGVHTHWEWVEGNAVESRGWRQCTLAKKLNYYANKFAELAFQSAISGSNIISGNYPLKLISVLTSGMRVMGLPCLALEKHRGYKIARDLYSNKQIVHETNFHLIWWEGIKAVMDDYPRMYQVWITKHVLEFCGTNMQIYYRHKGAHNPKCGCCNIEDEYTTHINRCLDPGRTEMFCTLVQDLTKWMQSTLQHQGVVQMVEDYLLFRNKKWMQDCSRVEEAGLRSLAIASNRLCWDCFLERHIARE